MFPQSHFLLALLLGVIAYERGLLGLHIAFLVAILAIFMDFDHVISNLVFHKKFDLKKMWHKTVYHIEHHETLLHNPIAFIVVSIIVGVVFIFNPVASLIIALAYYSHYLLDDLSIYEPEMFKTKEFGWLFNAGREELILNGVLIFLIIILLLV
ncbi:hypothetical protein ACFL0W_00660 [Nanoarchaeota archaeon]